MHQGYYLLQIKPSIGHHSILAAENFQTLVPQFDSNPSAVSNQRITRYHHRLRVIKPFLSGMAVLTLESVQNCPKAGSARLRRVENSIPSLHTVVCERQIHAVCRMAVGLYLLALKSLDKGIGCLRKSMSLAGQLISYITKDHSWWQRYICFCPFHCCIFSSKKVYFRDARCMVMR